MLTECEKDFLVGASEVLPAISSLLVGSGLVYLISYLLAHTAFGFVTPHVHVVHEHEIHWGCRIWVTAQAAYRVHRAASVAYPKPSSHGSSALQGPV